MARRFTLPGPTPTSILCCGRSVLSQTDTRTRGLMPHACTLVTYHPVVDGFDGFTPLSIMNPHLDQHPLRPLNSLRRTDSWTRDPPLRPSHLLRRHQLRGGGGAEGPLPQMRVYHPPVVQDHDPRCVRVLRAKCAACPPHRSATAAEAVFALRSVRETSGQIGEWKRSFGMSLHSWHIGLSQRER